MIIIRFSNKKEHFFVINGDFLQIFDIAIPHRAEILTFVEGFGGLSFPFYSAVGIFFIILQTEVFKKVFQIQNEQYPYAGVAGTDPSRHPQSSYNKCPYLARRILLGPVWRDTYQHSRSAFLGRG